MRKAVSLCLFGLFFLASAFSPRQAMTAQKADWNFIRIGLPGTKVKSLSIDRLNPRVMYALSDHAVFQSFDFGYNWTRLDALPGNYFYSVYVHPLRSRLVYAGSDLGMFKSLDAGASWEKFLPAFANMACDPRFLEPVYFTYDGNLYLTIDDGINWKLLQKGFRHHYRRYDLCGVEVAPLDSTIFTRLVSTEGSMGIIGVRGGETWIQNVPSKEFGDPWDASTIYGDRWGDLCKTVDYWNNWTVLKKNFPISIMRINPSNHDFFVLDEFYALGGYCSKEILTSWDDGYTWVSLGMFPGGTVHCLEIDDMNGFLYAGTDDGVYAMKIAPDNAPRIAIVSPSDGSMVYGTFSIQSIAKDENGVVKVEFYIDEQKIAEKSGTNQPGFYTFTFDWDTRPFSAGMHSLKGKVFNGAGLANQAEISVKVENVILDLQARKIVEKAWIIKQPCAQLNVDILNPGQASVAKYVIYRQVNSSGPRVTVKEFYEKDVVHDKFSCYDKLQKEAATYFYQVEAYDAAGTMLARSNTVTVVK